MLTRMNSAWVSIGDVARTLVDMLLPERTDLQIESVAPPDGERPADVIMSHCTQPAAINCPTECNSTDWKVGVSSNTTNKRLRGAQMGDRFNEPETLDLMTAPEIYADDICGLDALGPNLRVSYFTWRRGAGGIMERSVVLKLIRPMSSIIEGRHRISAWCRTGVLELSEPPQAPWQRRRMG
jgi:hypothetical protein